MPIKISIAKKGETVIATKVGKIKFTIEFGMPGVLDNVLFTPDIPYNLLSVRRIQKAGMRVTFSESGETLIEKNDKIIFTGKLLHNLMCVVFTINKNMCNQAYVDKTTLLNSYQIWQERLGHIEKSKLHQKLSMIKITFLPSLMNILITLLFIYLNISQKFLNFFEIMWRKVKHILI